MDDFFRSFFEKDRDEHDKLDDETIGLAADFAATKTRHDLVMHNYQEAAQRFFDATLGYCKAMVDQGSAHIDGSSRPTASDADLLSAYSRMMVVAMEHRHLCEKLSDQGRALKARGYRLER